MDRWLAPLPATQVARVQSPVLAGPMISVEKVALLCYPALGTRSQVLQLRLYRVYQKSLKGFARPNLRNPWNYRNGIGAKRCVVSLSFIWEY
jgi:hypothetical protein